MDPRICCVDSCDGCFNASVQSDQYKKSLILMVGVVMLILLPTIFTTLVHAGCTLQLHGYDAMGDGWEDTTISIKVGDEFIIEDWFVADSAHEFVEFYVEPVEIEIRVIAGDDRLDNYFRLTDQQGYTLYRPPQLRYDYIDIDVHCDLTDLQSLLRCTPATQNDESVCWDGYIDETNGGCDAQNPLFDTVQCGEIVCGTLGIYTTENQKISDSDWYEFHLDSYSDLQITASSEFPGTIEVYNPGDCSSPVLLGNHDVYFNDTIINVGFLSPGDYAIRLALDTRWDAPCSPENLYIFSLNCCPGGFHGEMQESESACDYNYVDEINAGCDALEPVFTQLFPGYSMMGMSGFFPQGTGWFQDTDWYAFHIVEPVQPDLMFSCAFPANIQVFSGDCSSLTELMNWNLESCESRVMEFPLELVPGDYLIRVAPSVTRGVSCDSDYILKVDTGDIGISVNSARHIDISELAVTPDYVVSVYGDTRLGKNCYSENEYGCGNNLDGSEFVGIIIPEQDIAVRLEAIRANWPTCLVVTRSWPPEECWYSDWYRGLNRGGFESLLFTAGQRYYVFVDGHSGDQGDFYLDISDTVERTELYDVDIDMNQVIFEPGDEMIISTIIESPYNENVMMQKCLLLKIGDQYWFFPDFTSEFRTTDVTFGFGLTQTLEYQLILPSVINNYFSMYIYFALLEFDHSSDIVFRSNIDHAWLSIHSSNWYQGDSQ